MNYTVRNLLVAAVLMLVGILAVTSFLRAERKDLEHGKQQIQVLVAAKDIPAGTSAKDLEKGGYLTTTDVLREDAPPNAIGKISSLKVDKKWLISNDTVYKDEVLTTRSFDDQQGLAPTHAIKAAFGNVSFMDILQPRFGETGRARTHLRRELIGPGSRRPFHARVSRTAVGGGRYVAARSRSM